MNLEAMAMKEYSAFPQSSSITETSPSDCLVSYPGYSLGGGSYLSAQMQSMYSTAPSDWATGYSLREGSYLSAQMQSVYSTAPDD